VKRSTILFSVALLIVLVVVLVVVVERGSLSRVLSRVGPAPTSSQVTTGSAQPYEIFFTTPKYPDRPEDHHGGIDEHLVQYIDAATRTLEVADYDFDLENVAQAMARAKGRGVVVRMVTDTDTLTNTKDQEIQKAFSLLRQADIPIVDDQRQAIMHHKFAVRDGEDVWTGSWNYTTDDTYRLNNNAVRLRSPELARRFADEFELMFSQRKFGPARGRATPAPPVQIGSARVQALFAPENGVATRIADRIKQASTSVGFLAFSFTHDGIGSSVIGRAQAGVPVVGVFERTGSETRFSEFGAMKQAGLEVYQDGSPYVMHHKVFVLDGQTTIFGSFNFSDGADTQNDENCLIVDDPAFTAQFSQEVDRMVALAKNPVSTRATPERQRPR